MLPHIKPICFNLATINRKPVKIPYQDILYLEGFSNYTLIHFLDGKYKLSPRTLLYHIRNSLDDSFIRIHRSFCVNKLYITNKSFEENLRTTIQLENGKLLSVARRRRKVLDY